MSNLLNLFGEELRIARQEAGLSQEDLATKINYSAAQVSAVERGTRRPSDDLANRADAVLGLNGRLSRLLAGIRHEAAQPALRPWLAFETEAVALRSYEPCLIPGLLQTEAYARALLSGGGLLTAAQIDEQVAVRIERQAVLARENPPQTVFVIDEQVLRRPLGGPEVMREQLLHILQLVDDCSRVRVHVVPLSVGGYAGLDGPLAVATSPEGAVAAYLDSQLTGTLVERPTDASEVIRAWEVIRGDALSCTQSRQLIEEAAEQWT
ncbi:helix-turn-helix domain-containing protein [Micromonospora zhanjiangensis]|uniref:Helix-turn-helix domain-containing protein n=1 Tax=Micromonospora zhanjiangensis TaxID=1522057 RepID=A0ABV8KVU3_9ACTN